jgi:hypothetical protein
VPLSLVDRTNYKQTAIVLNRAQIAKLRLAVGFVTIRS